MKDIIADRVLKICEEKDISIKELAKKINMSSSVLNDLIVKRKRMPRLSTVSRICDGLGLNVLDLFDSEEFTEIFRKR